MPFMQLFPGDWLKDPAVSGLSPAARGIWFDLICVMHEAGRSGVIAGTRASLSRMARCSTDELGGAINEFQLCNTCDVSEDGNTVVTLVNRRMKREADGRKSTANRVAEFRERERSNDLVTPASRPILQSSTSEFRDSDKASKPCGIGFSRRMAEVAKMAEETLNGEWCNDAGKWMNRIKADPEKVFRVMADVRSAIVERRVKKTPAAMAEFNWGIFK